MRCGLSLETIRLIEAHQGFAARLSCMVRWIAKIQVTCDNL